MSKFGILFLTEARKRGLFGIPVPHMDIFQRLELKSLWFSGVLTVSGFFKEGCGHLILTKRGRCFVDAHREDWPSFSD